MLIYRSELGCHKASNHSIPLMNFKEIEDIKRGPTKVLTKKQIEAIEKEKRKNEVRHKTVRR